MDDTSKSKWRISRVIFVNYIILCKIKIISLQIQCKIGIRIHDFPVDKLRNVSERESRDSCFILPLTDLLGGGPSRDHGGSP